MQKTPGPFLVTKKQNQILELIFACLAENREIPANVVRLSVLKQKDQTLHITKLMDGIKRLAQRDILKLEYNNEEMFVRPLFDDLAALKIVTRQQINASLARSHPAVRAIRGKDGERPKYRKDDDALLYAGQRYEDDPKALKERIHGYIPGRNYAHSLTGYSGDN